MRPPDERDLDDEIRGHLALAIKERIDRGEDPESARRSALREFGYIPEMRDSMRRVWFSRWFESVSALVRDMRHGWRSLLRTPGLTATVIVTLALGIGANAAIFSVVRDVLLRPLVNRGEDRLVYLRQSAPGIQLDNTTFSVAEIQDFRTQVKSISAFGEFSTINPIITGLGLEPRSVTAGVVNGAFFDVMGLRPVVGRLVNLRDDGQKAEPVAVLTYRFWSSALHRDPSVVGKTITIGDAPVKVIGVLEPSVPYPTSTEIIANMATSPHHNGALMQTNRSHRMTEVFGRLAPGATIESARAELATVHAAIVRAHPEAYAANANMTLTVTRLREQIVSPARTVLILLLAAAAIVFLIACSNVANLILARSVRREGELAVRAALGASRGALRRTLLAESLVLCGAGAAFGLLAAGPSVTLVASFASRFSIRAFDVSVDSTLLWIGAGLAVMAAVMLAYIPRLPSAHAPNGLGLAAGGLRVTPATNRRLRIFATTQIACSFVLLAAAATLLVSVIALQTARTGLNLRQIVAFEVPSPGNGSVTDPLYGKVVDRIRMLPGVRGVAIGSAVPWRDGKTQPFQFTVEGFTPANGEPDPYALQRFASPGLFAVLGIPLLDGREFGDEDRRTGAADTRERAAIVSQSLAERMFPSGNALNRHIQWTDPVQALRGTPSPRRIVGIVADFDDENIVPAPVMTIYTPTFELFGLAQRIFVRTDGDPDSVKSAVTQVIREAAPDRPVEHVATLEEARGEVLAPERLKAFVLSGFAGIALLIAVVGVAGVLAFSVSVRIREFGVRLAMGSTPRHLMTRVLLDGATIVVVGLAAGAVSGYLLKHVVVNYLGLVDLPGTQPLMVAGAVLIGAALFASLMPALRASRVDVLQALRSE